MSVRSYFMRELIRMRKALPCEPLLHYMYFRGLTNKYRSPYLAAWSNILSNEFDAETSRKLQLVFSDSDTLEQFRFTLLHKIVLGILPLNLTLALQGLTRAHVNEGDSGGRTALFWAVKRGDAKCLKILLEYGADPHKLTKLRYSALHHAAYSHSHSCTRLLLDAHVNVDIRGPLQETPLMNATYRLDSLDTARLLIDHGADINARDYTGGTAISWASLYRHFQLVAYLAEQGADLHNIEITGDTVVHTAVIGNSPTIIRLLLR